MIVRKAIRGAVVAATMIVAAATLTSTTGLAEAPRSPEPAAHAPGHGGAVRVHTDARALSRSFTPPTNAPAKEDPVQAPSAVLGECSFAYVCWSTPFTIKQYEIWDAWQYCPSGAVASGGGESNTSAGGVLLHASSALENGAGWKVTVTNLSTADATFRVYVKCTDLLSGYHLRDGKTLVEPNRRGAAAASCPGGMQAVGGGGWSDTIYSEIVGTGPYPAINGWSFDMTNLDSAARTVNAQVACATGIWDYEVVLGAFHRVEPGQVGRADVTCPPGKAVFSGGGGSTGTKLTDSYPDVNARSWTVYAFNPNAQPIGLSATAVCGI